MDRPADRRIRQEESKNDHRRSRRESDFLPISVSVQNDNNHKIIAGPFAGELMDISRHGALLLMTQIMMKSFHVFHSTRENDVSRLLLHINIPPDLIDFQVPARPIWIALMKYGLVRAYKIGVEFRTDSEDEQIDEILSALKKEREKRQKISASLDLTKGL